ncbi:MAG: alpha/beta fold hydrolase [Solirubrobacterales bacterium]
MVIGELGEGSPVALLHGFAQTGECWWGVAEPLATKWRVLRVDLPGHGRSGPLPPDADQGSVARELLGDLEAAGAAGSALLGYSFGARIALRAALEAPTPPSALVLVGATAGIRDAETRSERLQRDRALADRLETGGIKGFVGRWEANEVFATQPPELVARQRPVRLTQDPSGLATTLRRLGVAAAEPLWDRLAELAVPTLVVCGERDERYRHTARELAAAIPGAIEAVIEGAGHAAHLERPERFVELVTAFLDRVGEPAPDP